MRHDATADTPHPIEEARRRTGAVQDDLEVAGAELGLVQDALDRHLPAEVRSGDVAWALEHSAAVERKVVEAAEELDAVTELLVQEERERARLERELADCRSGA